VAVTGSAKKGWWRSHRTMSLVTILIRASHRCNYLRSSRIGSCPTQCFRSRT
jgi:hypothetical protein